MTVLNCNILYLPKLGLQAETFYEQPERLSLFAANNGSRVETGVVIFIWLRIHC